MYLYCVPVLRLSLLVKNRKILVLHLGEAAHKVEIDSTLRADVCEVSHSVFDEMERSWRGQVASELTEVANPDTMARAA